MRHIASILGQIMGLADSVGNTLGSLFDKAALPASAPDDEAVERVAAGIFDKLYPSLNWQGFLAGNHIVANNKQYYLDVAKAAIAALSQPNKEDI
jgi:hypothetical protein